MFSLALPLRQIGVPALLVEVKSKKKTFMGEAALPDPGYHLIVLMD